MERDSKVMFKTLNHESGVTYANFFFMHDNANEWQSKTWFGFDRENVFRRFYNLSS